MLRDVPRYLTVAVTMSVLALGACAIDARGQAAPALELTMPSLMAIAVDFDAGRNSMYCYFGTRTTSALPFIHVDSVSIVATPSACDGVGIAFISRISDSAFLMHALRGLIESNPNFLVVSAFYRTEDLWRDGQRVRTPRALSVMRGGARAIVTGSS